jgi:hypothetical protein
MKALFWKELRESIGITVLGFAIFALLLGTGFGRLGQPLLDAAIQMPAGFFCPIFGALLGWLQAHREHHRDLRAFLVHRPITRTRIFFGKVLAGAALYFLGAGLPLLLLVGVVQTPGQVAAPFEWAMTLPLLASFLTGIAAYFAGMLTALRPAKWYGSRGLGLIVAVMVAGCATGVNEFWQALIVAVAGGAILGVAAWGSFQTGGIYRDQPLRARLALAASLTVGSAMVALLAAAIAGWLLTHFGILSGAKITYSTSWLILKDGTIGKAQVGRYWEFKDLEGKPLQDAKSGELISDLQNKHVAPTSPMVLENGSLGPGFHSYRDRGRYYYYGGLSPGDGRIYWYYVHRDQRLEGYDHLSRQFVGSIGPEGFARDFTGNGSRFATPWLGPQYCLSTSNTVFRPDPANRNVKPIFTTTNGDDIIGLTSFWTNINSYGPGEFTVVVTRKFVHLLGVEGELLWKQPYQSHQGAVKVSVLEAPGSYALWYVPVEPGSMLPTCVSWIDRERGEERRMAFPAVVPKPGSDPTVSLMGLVSPPVFMSWLVTKSPAKPSVESLIFSAGMALVCAIAVLLLARHQGLGFLAQLGWIGFILLCGLPGLIAFVCVREWTAHEICPNCKKSRIVDHEHCEHCGAEFAPPEKNGIEIFEPLGTHAPP